MRQQGQQERPFWKFGFAVMLVGYAIWLVPQALEDQVAVGERSFCERIVERAVMRDAPSPYSEDFDAMRRFLFPDDDARRPNCDRVGLPGEEGPMANLVRMGAVLGAIAMYYALAVRR